MMTLTSNRCRSSGSDLLRAVVMFFLLAVVTIVNIDEYDRLNVAMLLPKETDQRPSSSSSAKNNNDSDLLPIRNLQKLLLEKGTIYPVPHYMRPLTRDDDSTDHHDSSSSAENKNVTVATCAVLDHPNLQHFPHASQQLFRCWSYWQYHHDRPPVLYWKADVKKRTRSSYVETMLEMWQKELNLFIIDGNSSITTEWDIGAMSPNGSGFALGSIEDARAFRTVMASTVSERSAPCTGTMPRIAILNRQGSRSIVGAEALARSLEKALSDGTTTSTTRNDSIPVAYFEETSFQYQVDFMANTDIVISPHGAQLTSIIAMPPCGGLLEIYPIGYYPISFFGSLADASGIYHQPYYMGNNSDVYARGVDQEFASSDYHQRVLDRSVQMCPNHDEIVWLARRLIETTNLCCQKKNRPKRR